MFGGASEDHGVFDPAITPLGRLLQEEIAPVVMVLTTPLVEDSCIKNALSLVQIFTPFCFFDNIDVPVRTASDQPYRLQKFNLRLLYASSIIQPDLEVSKGHLGQVIRSAEESILDLPSEPPNIGDVMVAPQCEILPSWIECFNKELIRIPSFSDHEAFDHPVVCLLVISSKDEQPINRFVDLFNTNQLPSLLNDGMMDPKILKHYLLVHDNQDGLPDEAENILNEMKITFGSNDCHLLCINSSEVPSEDRPNNPWISYNINSLPNNHIGRYLDIDDENMLKQLMHDLSSKHIIPHMEQKIRTLNQQVSMTRKGFRNQIKNLWWRKGKEDTEDAPDGPLYTFSSIESQIRVLGDYAFMLHDYELALANYRLLSTDYKLDKAWKRYAGVQEMMGLSYFMLDVSRKEAEYCMENAFNIYMKIGSSGWKNAVRCGLWWAEMLKTFDQFNDAAAVYSRVSGQEPLHSAVLLEQASYCYLFSKPPMLRKHGFHLVLSGDLYKRCNQIKHAIRTYRCALSVYRDTTWKPVNDHVRFYIGKWYALLGNFDVAIRLMLQILECNHQSGSNQGLFLLDFIEIVERVGKEFEVPGLQLPVINMKSLKVLHEDHRTYGSAASVSVSENVWKSLEADMIPPITTSKTNWLESQSNMTSKINKELNICVVGEPVKVAIEFRNPLQVFLYISNVELICEISRRSDKCASEAKYDFQNNEEINHSSGSSNPMSHSSLFTLSNAAFSLGGDEAFVARLEVTPFVEGVLKITGIRWRLSTFFGGFYNFTNPETETVHKRRIKSRSTVHDFLEFIVIGNLPRLEVSIHRFPKKVYVGALHGLHLELKNESDYHIKNLKMNVSHPRMIHVATYENPNADFSECIEKRADYEQGFRLRNFNDFSSSVFTFPEIKLIGCERPLLWPIWLRATSAGPVSLYLTLYYEMEDTSKVIKFRCLRMYYSLEVLPSLNLDFKFFRFPSKLDELLVRMDVKNETDSNSFLIHQLAVVGGHWEISLIQPLDTVLLSSRVPPGRAFSFFFNLKNEKNTADRSPSSQIQVRSMSFSSSEQDGPHFDLSTSPFADFHSSERWYQRKDLPSQEGTLSVDFLLISRLLLQRNHPDPTPLFLSHHTCGCSFAETGPIWWVLDGPQAVSHDFSLSFCEVPLTIRFQNVSAATAVVQVVTAYDNLKADSGGPEKAVGEPGRVKPEAWVWSGPINKRVEVRPWCCEETPLQISVFSPGVYDLSDYFVKWTLIGVDQGGGSARSGRSKGLPFFVRVKQETS